MILRAIYRFIVLLVISVFLFTQNSDADSPAIGLLKKDGVIVKGFRPGNDSSRNSITYLGFQDDWTGNHRSFANISNCSVMLMSFNGAGDVSDDAWHALRGMSAKYVKIERTFLSSEGVKHLASIDGVKTLTLKEVPVTDDSIDDIARMTSLQRLNLWETKMTREGVVQLQKKLPKCKIHANWW